MLCFKKFRTKNGTKTEGEDWSISLVGFGRQRQKDR